MSTNYEVVQAQRDFLDAQNNELRAQLNYRKALVNFETVQTVGTRGVGARSGGAGGGTTTGGGTTRRRRTLIRSSSERQTTVMKKLHSHRRHPDRRRRRRAVFYAKRGEKEPTVTTLQTSRGDIVDGVGATGTLQAVTTVTVGTQVSGIVQELTPTSTRSSRRGRSSPGSIRRSSRRRSRRAGEPDQRQANLERQKVAVDDAKSKLTRAKELSARQLINKVDLENAEVSVKSAEAQMRSTQSSIVQAEASVNKATVDLDHTVITGADRRHHHQAQRR
jgi:multidrug efflux pump subunit AcrA (membrane-fusion protein)